MPGFQADTSALASAPADSATGLAADSLTRYAVDSLARPAVDTLAPAAEMWDAAAVYGPGSEKIANALAETLPHQSLPTDSMWFQIPAMVALAAYCFMMYYYREQVRMCLKGIVNFKPEDKFTREHGHLYNSFIACAVTLASFSAGIGGAKAAAVFAAVDGVPPYSAPLASVFFWALSSAIIFVQVGILKAAGKLTYTRLFTDALIEIKTMHLAGGTIFVTPAVILFSGVNPAWDAIIMYIIAGMTVIIALIFVLRTFLLFVRQKVSILVWILYLCAIEIFPLALAAALLVKNF